MLLSHADVYRSEGRRAQCSFDGRARQCRCVRIGLQFHDIRE